MSIINRTLKKGGAFATAFLGAIVAESYGSHLENPASGPLLIVLSHLLTHIGSEYVGPLGEEIIDQFNHKQQNELNHDIQKALIDSMQKAIDGLKILYKDKYPNQPLDRKTKIFLRTFKNEFIEEFTPKGGFTIEENDLKKLIYGSSSKEDNKFLYSGRAENIITEKINQKLAEELSNGNVNNLFKDLFLEKFLHLTQYYFSENLKHNKNSAARRAMERMLSEETLIGINKLLSLQDKTETEIKSQKWLGKVGKLNSNKIRQLKGLVGELNEPKRLEIQFGEALDDKFIELTKQYHELHNDVIRINTQIHAIRNILSLNMRFAIIFVIISSVITTIIVIQNQNSPFNVTFTLEKDPKLEISNQYPSIRYPAKMYLLLPNGKTENAIINLGTNNEAFFPQIEAKWLHKKMYIKLDDIYWETSSDSVMLSDIRMVVPIRPNNVLRSVHGNVISKNDGNPIKNAKVFINDVSVLTDTIGDFKTVLPYKALKDIYLVKISADGFYDFKDYYRPNSTDGQFHLTPLK